jgi:uncharacterized protein related to proFAR isomerase
MFFIFLFWRMILSEKSATFRDHALDHDDFGLTQSKIMNVIDSKSLERDAGGKPVSTFPHPALEDLIAAFPSVTFWVDAGVRDAVEARSWLHRHENSHLVLGTESLINRGVLAELAGERRLILSLDYRGEEFLGPEEILDRPHLWPARVIVMTLTRVGSGAGPDMERLALIGSRAPNATLFAAGGLRGPSDLMRLEEAGVRGVLVASALHDGRLTGADLAAARQGASKEK